MNVQFQTLTWRRIYIELCLCFFSLLMSISARIHLVDGGGFARALEKYNIIWRKSIDSNIIIFFFFLLCDNKHKRYTREMKLQMCVSLFCAFYRSRSHKAIQPCSLQINMQSRNIIIIVRSIIFASMHIFLTALAAVTFVFNIKTFYKSPDNYWKINADQIT